MTQPTFSPARHPLLSNEEKERALARVKYYVNSGQPDRWAILSWFVKLASINFGEMSKGQLSDLQEEFRAIQQEALRFTANQPNIEAVQRLVCQHLKDVVDRGRTNLGPFKLELSVFINQARSPKFPRPVYGGEFVHPWEGDGMVYLLGRLLQELGASLKRCERCHALFLQARPKQRFCGRTCQSRNIMQEKRDREKAKKAHAKKIQRNTRTSSAKGGKRHGRKK